MIKTYHNKSFKLEENKVTKEYRIVIVIDNNNGTQSESLHTIDRGHEVMVFLLKEDALAEIRRLENLLAREDENNWVRCE